MAIGRSEDRDNPWDPLVLGHHWKCLGPDPRTPSGPAAFRAAHKGRTYDRNRPEPFLLPNPCEAGAVHIWVPAGACPRAARSADPWAGKARKELSISISIRIFSQTLSSPG